MCLLAQIGGGGAWLHAALCATAAGLEAFHRAGMHEHHSCDGTVHTCCFHTVSIYLDMCRAGKH